MLRIDVIDRKNSERILHLEGKISGCWVLELKNLISESLRMKKRIILDFSGVNFLDEEAMRMLKQFANKGLEMRNGSLFIQALLGAKKEA
ncbi:MAG: anti-sigma factor antagonist [Candidatus Aminicenantes bacterium]|nr:anti-sigma factor antagonist [Candidatus Aminicenantes bacterium]